MARGWIRTSHASGPSELTFGCCCESVGLSWVDFPELIHIACGNAIGVMEVCLSVASVCCYSPLAFPETAAP